MELTTFSMHHTTTQYVRTDQFKTRVISVRFFRDFELEDAASRYLMFAMLRAKNETFPTRKAHARHLESLYDALWLGGSSKLGTQAINTLSMVVIDDRYTMGNTLFEDALKHMRESVFNPVFDETLLEEEKRFLKDLINSEIADKVSHAGRRFIRHLMAQHPYRGSPRGDLKAIDNVTLADIKRSYADMRDNSRVFITVVGDIDVDSTHRCVETIFDLHSVPQASTVIHRHRFEALKRLHDPLESKQTRLFSSYASDIYFRDDDYLVMETLNCLFGAGSDSMLFNSVREEAALAYDISSGYSPTSGLVTVSAGVSLNNVSNVEERVQACLDDIRKENFSEDALALAKKTLISGYKQSYDSIGNLSQKALHTALFDIPFREETLIGKIEAIRREDLVRVAKTLRPVFTFSIGGEDDGS